MMLKQKWRKKLRLLVLEYITESNLGYLNGYKRNFTFISGKL